MTSEQPRTDHVGCRFGGGHHNRLSGAVMNTVTIPKDVALRIAAFLRAANDEDACLETHIADSYADLLEAGTNDPD